MTGFLAWTSDGYESKLTGWLCWWSWSMVTGNEPHSVRQISIVDAR